MSEIIQAIADVQQVAGAVSNEPNWLVIGIILGIMVILAIVFIIPSKSQPMLDADEDEDDEKKSLPGEKREALGAEEAGEKKLSLAEIKKEKRANVSEEKSKEELRELRRERRAATQTEKAVSERENAEDAEAAKETKAEAKSEAAAKADEEVKAEEAKVAEAAKAADTMSEAVKAAEEAARKAAEEAAEADRALKEAEEEARKARENLEMALKSKDLERSLEADVVSNSEPEDVFSSLFGDEDSSLDFDEFSKADSKPVEGTVFPTLGSALIPLDQLAKAADEAEADIDPFEELTKRMAAKAEKKTLK